MPNQKEIEWEKLIKICPYSVLSAGDCYWHHQDKSCSCYWREGMIDKECVAEKVKSLLGRKEQNETNRISK